MAILQADYSTLNHEEMASAIGLKAKHIPILIASFISESNGAITKLQEAIQIKNYDEIHKNAHFIKGSAGNLKFNEVYEMAKDMELSATAKDENFDYQGHFSAIEKVISTIK